MTDLFYFTVGLGCLILGGEWLVRGASRIAKSFGIPSLIIGLTVVAFGTSAPELAVSLTAALSGSSDLAVGNVVGSNIFNVLFILGISALLTPLTVARQLVRLEVPLMIGSTVLLMVLSFNGVLGKAEGALLLLCGLLYLAWLIRSSRREKPEVREEYAPFFGGSRVGRTWVRIRSGVLVILGLLLLVQGSRWLVSAAVSVALGLGVSEGIVGLTIVAAGTSMPEVATSLVAAFRGERDIAVGNVLGSNLFNLCFILGTATAVAPDGLPIARGILYVDIPFLLAVSIACLPIFVTGHRIDRWEGALFLGYYVLYTADLIFQAVEHDSALLFRQMILFFVVPLTALTLVISLVRTLGRRENLEKG